jgi:molybdate transport system ATP-binding protein
MAAMTDSTPGSPALASITDQPLITLEHVDVALAGQTVLHDLNWELRLGEHWAVIGPNGSGKTSFLRLLAGTLWPAPGAGKRRYRFGGEPQTDAIEALGRITLVGHELQDRYTRLGWNFDAVDVVMSGLAKTDVPRRQTNAADRIRARGLLRQLKLLHLAERPFLELSRGEQRRVLIARGLAFKPTVLILDEPAAGLDPRSRRALDETIDQLSRQTTIICSFHEPVGLPSSLNTMLRLEHGRIVERGPVPAEARAPSTVAMLTPAPSPLKETPPAKRNSAGDTPALIVIEHADVWLDHRRALADVSWTLREGEHWQLTGPNGAGKSTFLRLLHGQLRPAKGGSLRYPGIANPENVWSLRKQVAWVSPELQAGYWYPTNVRQCIASGFDSSIGQTRRLKPEEKRTVEELLETFDLQALAERNVKALSYGQFRRVLIARAVVRSPRVLLLDEPWEGLDPRNLELVSRELNQIIARGSQLVCATHLAVNGAHFNRYMRIEAGRLVEEAPGMEHA